MTLCGFLGCVVAGASHGFGRAALAAAALAFAVRQAAALLAGRTRVVRFTWNRAGEWRIRLACGGPLAARLTSAWTLLGPWTVLAWTDSSNRRHYAVVDLETTGRCAYAALRSRLRLEPRASRRRPARLRPKQAKPSHPWSP